MVNKLPLATMKVGVLFVTVFAPLAVGMIGVVTPAAVSAGSSCPSGGTPPPGSKVDGGLEVDGTCVLIGVAVNGGITVDASGHLSLRSSRVNGGIVVRPNGELDINATTNGAGVPTGTFSTINGGITINSGFDADIWDAQINGGISVIGAFPLAFPLICANEITGGVKLSNISTPFGFFLGDPELLAPGGARTCTGNTINGSVTVSNSSGLKVEGNTVAGSVLLSGSTLELNGNTINGSLRCSNGTMILPGEGPDPIGNTVHGANHC